MRAGAFNIEDASFHAFHNPKTHETHIIVKTEEGEQKIRFKSGRDLAYLIRFATKLLALHMKFSKKCKAEIEDAIHTHAQAGIDEAIENEPVQVTLGVIR